MKNQNEKLDALGSPGHSMNSLSYQQSMFQQHMATRQQIEPTAIQTDAFAHASSANPPPGSTLQVAPESLRHSSADSQDMINTPNSMISNIRHSSANHKANQQFSYLNDDIIKCDEQLAILQRMKNQNEKLDALGSPGHSMNSLSYQQSMFEQQMTTNQQKGPTAAQTGRFAHASSANSPQGSTLRVTPESMKYFSISDTTQGMSSKPNTMVSKSMVHMDMQQFSCLKDDIRICDEQLAILQEMKTRKEKRISSISPGHSSTEAPVMNNEANATVLQHVSQVARDHKAMVNTSSPSSTHNINQHLHHLNKDISNYEEQLAILQELKNLKKKLHLLERTSTTRQVTSPTSLS